jgi:CRP-like cAMP-binding protein
MDPHQNNHKPINNRILSVLTTEERERLLPHLEKVELRLGDVLSESQELIQYAYFPQGGTISVITVMADGGEVEVGVIGNEGMYGLPLVLGTNSSPLRAIVQLPGMAVRMKADVLKEEAARCGTLQQALLRYGQAFFIQTAQTAACNRLHPLDGRFARWLFDCQDRAKSDELPLTHEFMATMLGVRRAGVSVAANKLREDGLINYTRGIVTIINRDGLEACSCECYEIVKREFDRLPTVSTQIADSSSRPSISGLER